MGYIAHYGYTDGSGQWYITADTSKCNGCGDCVKACPIGVLETVIDDYDDKVVSVAEAHRKSIRFSCAPCKPVGSDSLPPCVRVCESRAIKHSW